jgi:hypothetical protein
LANGSAAVVVIVGPGANRQHAHGDMQRLRLGC